MASPTGSRILGGADGSCDDSSRCLRRSDDGQGTDVESFVNEINGALLEKRRQRINDVAYSSDTTEAADAVAGE